MVIHRTRARACGGLGLGGNVANVTKSPRGRDGRPSHLRLVGSTPGPTHRTTAGVDVDTTPSVAVLETLLETLSLDLAAAPPALHPVIAEASVARSAAMLADQLWPAG